MSSGDWRLPSREEVAQLDRGALGALYREVVALQADVFIRLTACQHESSVPTDGVTSRDSWFTVKEAAEHWRKSPCWMRRAIKRGAVRARKLGGEWRIPANEVLDGT